MHTLANLVRDRRSLPSAAASTGAWPYLAKPKAKLVVSGEKPIILPADVMGLHPVDGPGSNPMGIRNDDARAARALLMYSPSIVIPLQRPPDQSLSALGLKPSDFRNENPRAVGTAVAVQLPDGQVLYGTSRIVVLENGIRMGSTLIVENCDYWTRDLGEAEGSLLDKCESLSESFPLAPEPGQKPWPTVIALLGGSDETGRLPADWKRRFKLAAAFRQVNLDIRPSPDSSRRYVLHDLRTNPPDGLLVWAEWVSVPDVYLMPYQSARPDAYAQLLGSAKRGSMNFADHLVELQMHLREVSPIFAAEPSDLLEEGYSWIEATSDIEALTGPHFVLTPRAARMLEGNPYPKPRRMLEFVEKLACVAQEFHNSRGNIGGRLADYAIDQHGIQIALFDTKLAARRFNYDGVALDAEPHVKVDDAKSPDQVGRIYFAIDRTHFRFVVDHIGLHDYH